MEAPSGEYEGADSLKVYTMTNVMGGVAYAGEGKLIKILL